MISKISKILRDDNKFPEDISYNIRAELYSLAPNDTWSYVSVNQIALHKLYLHSSSGLVYSLLSHSLVGLEKKSKHDLKLLNKLTY